MTTGHRGGAGYESDEPPFRPQKRPPFLERTFPVVAQARTYDLSTARKDAVAGITIAALAVPAAMAYAELAGLSPVAGLYALVLPAIAYTCFGSSRQLIVGPEGTLALLTLTVLAPLAVGDASHYATLAATLAVVVGALFCVARLFHLGWIADYFSKAVLVGYIHGVAFVLICGQIQKLTGVPIGATGALRQVGQFVQRIGHADLLTVLVAAVSLLALLLLRWLAPRIPGSLVVVVGGIILSYLFDLKSHGVAVVGPIPAGLPSIRLPHPSMGSTLRLLPGALGIFAVGYADGVLTARSFAGRNGQHIDANQELLALGAANLGAGLTQGFPVGGSGSRTAVNDQLGGRTQFAGLMAAVVVTLVVLLFTGPVANLPNACLGAVIVAAAIALVDPAAWRALARSGRSQVVIAAVTTVGVFAFGVLQALIVAVGLSAIDVVVRSANPHDAVLGRVERLGRWANVSTHRSAQVVPGVVVYRLDDRLLFANARYVKGRIRESVAGAPSETRFLVFNAEALIGIDASGVEAVEQIMRSLDRSGITFVVANLKGFAEEQFEDTRLMELIGRDRFFPTVDAAIAWCEAQLT